ncbi:MAG TPA: SDR family oxidoreductase [Mycobacteriales bacterium]|nr:SDR family oxidoreductase [Mycobacteriales bacterium]
MSTSMDGKVAVITGAARGIGAQLARTLAQRGATVALLGLEPDLLEKVSSSIPGSTFHVVDVTDSDGLMKAAEEVVGQHGRVDVVVANAGIAAGGPLLLADAATYDRVIEVNVLGSVRTFRAFLPHLVESKGYVLQVASLAALVPGPMLSAYCASKSGVEALAHSLRGELKPHGVDAGVAYLTWTDTDMVRGIAENPGLESMRRSLPYPFNKTAPLAPAVERIADGIEKRKLHVYAQWWLPAVYWTRTLVPFLLGNRIAAQQAAKAEAAVRAAGVEATLPSGDGGRAGARLS